MRCVTYRGVGGREVVAVEERPEPKPGRFEILISTRYAGINPADVLQREGKHPPPVGSPADIPGLEVAGTVVGCGESVSDWQEGDVVFGLVNGGGLAEAVVAHEHHVTRVPVDLDEHDAAAIPEAFIVAHDALVTQAGLNAGETLLIMGANGGVGTAAVQIAKVRGARVIAGVRSEDVRPRVAALGANALEPVSALEHARELGGADVVLELVGGAHVAHALEVLAERGRIIVVSTSGGDRSEVSLRSLMRKRAQLIGTALRSRSLEEKSLAVSAFSDDVIPLIDDGRAKAIVQQVFPIEAAADALDAIGRPGKFGKLLLAM